jgi:hypothetical protein
MVDPLLTNNKMDGVTEENCEQSEEISALLQYYTRYEGSPRYFAIVHREEVVIKVFVGGHHANQSVPFAAAFQMLSEKYNNKIITPHYLFVKDIRENKLWDEKTIVDWLLDGDAHFILTHIHQGLENIIKVNLLKKNLLRLSAHPGFPTRLQITCPIFTQDKGRYLTAIKDIIFQ